MFCLVSVLYADLARRSTGSYIGTPIDGWIQVWIVVHLELPVEFKSPFPPQNGGPKCVETAGEIGSLFLEHEEAGLIPLTMWLCGGGACGLLAGVEYLQGEDGEAVNDEAGCLGVERGSSVLWRDGGEEPGVHLLDEVVALLVEAINGVLDAGNLGVGGGRVAGLVFLVPEVEVGTVICGGQLEQAFWLSWNSRFRWEFVQRVRGGILQTS
jgi:hypothetical protein